MGEYADMAIEAAMDRCCSWGPNRPRRYSRPKMPSCGICHKTHLYWRQDKDGKWFVAEFDTTRQVYEPHVCKFKWK